MPDLTDIDPWNATDEERNAWYAKEQAIKEADPAYRIRKENIRRLCGFIANMVYPPGPFRNDSVELRGGHIVQLNPPKPLQKGEYPWNADWRLDMALWHYCYVYRRFQPKLAPGEEAEHLSRLPLHLSNLILESCEIAKWPYKLGAALYIHQQMAVRQRDDEPSQGKAQWLVAKAPIKNIEQGGKLLLRPDGGEPSKVGDQWKKYFAVAHFWAAFVLWTKSPLDYPAGRFTLIDFICNADPVEFLANAAAFVKFRAAQETTRTKTVPFIRKGIDHDFIEDNQIVPTNPDSIPDLLAPYQWSALSQYKTRPRRERSTTS